jgi:hypothetical protein
MVQWYLDNPCIMVLYSPITFFDEPSAFRPIFVQQS